MQQRRKHPKKPLRNPFHLKLTALSPQMHNAFIPIYYANATSLAKLLSNKKWHLLSAQGQISADKRSNLLYIRDIAKNLKQIKQVIAHFDKPVAQVLIKARIVNIDDNYIKSLGVIFHGVIETAHSSDQLNMNYPALSTEKGTFTIPIIKLKDGSLLDMQLDALEKEGRAELVSSPELMTINRKPAVIEAGEDVPYQETTSSGATSVAFKKAVLRLKVVPNIMPHHYILLHLTVNQDKVSALSVNGVPAIQTQQLDTQVLVKNRQTVVLGGIYEQMNSKQQGGIPILRKLPLLGALFRHTEQTREHKELLIFVTPEIIR